MKETHGAKKRKNCTQAEFNNAIKAGHLSTLKQLRYPTSYLEEISSEMIEMLLTSHNTPILEHLIDKGLLEKKEISCKILDKLIDNKQFDTLNFLIQYQPRFYSPESDSPKINHWEIIKLIKHNQIDLVRFFFGKDSTFHFDHDRPKTYISRSIEYSHFQITQILLEATLKENPNFFEQQPISAKELASLIDAKQSDILQLVTNNNNNFKFSDNKTDLKDFHLLIRTCINVENLGMLNFLLKDPLRVDSPKYLTQNLATLTHNSPNRIN